MSSGSKQTVLSVLIVMATYVFVGWLAISRHASVQTAGPVHLVVPPVTEIGAAVPPPDPHVLRVCSDPNNLPFSDHTERGFENRLAELTARELHRSLVYYWQPQRRGFIRTALNAGRCDVVIGVPTASEMVRVTRPYYRSSFMFVSRRRRRPLISSFDDPRLQHLRVGIP